MKRFLQAFLVLLPVFVGTFTYLTDSDAYHYKPSSITTAGNNWNTASRNLERAISHLENLNSKAGDIEVRIDENNEELRDALLETLQSYSIDVISAWASALSAAALTGYDIYDGIKLREALNNVAGAINSQMDKVGTENDPPASSWNDASASYFARRKKAYNDYVGEINLYNAGHSGDDIGLPTQSETTHNVARRTPPPVSDGKVACVGGCGDRGPGEYIWFSWRVYQRPQSRAELATFGVTPEDSDQDIRLVTISSHRTFCNETVDVLGLPIGNCKGWYYNCTRQTSADCWNASEHSAPDDDDDSSSSASIQPCGHSTSASGDHSLQASCTSTDANGNSCTVTSFYACDSHSHSYPETPTETDYTPDCSYCSYGCSSCGANIGTFNCGHTGPWSEESNHTGYGCTMCSGTYYACDTSEAARHSNSGNCSKCSVWSVECQSLKCSEGGTCSW